MVAEQIDTKLASDYEAIRRREYELITSLLDTLPKIDGLSEDRVTQVRDALFHADHPFLMVFVGPFNAGKSSLINALLGKPDVLRVGPVPTTDRISILRWGEDAQRMNSGGEVDTVFYPSPLLKKVSFVDTPGLESVFQKHEEITRKFLHRSDVVLLVMLATQAMTARNMEYLQTLKEYGKKVILVINQSDLLTSNELDTVRDYVLAQSQDHLGFKPEIWLVSAKQGLEAHSHDPVDTALWDTSGLGKIEQYIDSQLGDVDRLRQKLQTPLQITQNVHRVALDAVKANQSVLDNYQSIAQNVDQQLAGFRREQDKIVREITAEISDKFGAATMQGSEAIREMFRLSHALALAGRGFMEVPIFSWFFRRLFRPQPYVRTAFDRHKALDPINQLPTVVDKLGPRLEGKDIQDIDSMVKYARREIDALPPVIRSKVIGTVQAPLKYDRNFLQQVRPDLETIENEAHTLETDQLEQTVKATLLYLAVWEILVIVLFIFVLTAWGGIASQPGVPNTFVMLLVVLAFGLLGLVLMPLRGRFLESAYTNRMLKTQSRYIETLTKGADKQVEYGMQLRRDAVSPLTRLVEAQTQIQKEQMSQLQTAEQEMVQIESDLAKLGKRALFGLKG